MPRRWRWRRRRRNVRDERRELRPFRHVGAVPLGVGLTRALLLARRAARHLLADLRGALASRVGVAHAAALGSVRDALERAAAIVRAEPPRARPPAVREAILAIHPRLWWW